LIFSVLILSLLIVTTRYSAVATHSFFSWPLFHLFVGVLLLVEALTAWRSPTLRTMSGSLDEISGSTTRRTSART
jgi:hypothetical protein